MIKVKPWIRNVYRVPNSTVNRHDYIRLDKSERITPYTDNFYKNFIKSLKQEDFIAYPETHKLVDSLCKHHKVNSDCIFISPGTDAAIKAFFEITVSPKEEVIITKPCFPMFNVYVELFDATPREIGYRPDLSFDFESMLNAISEKTSLIIMANPNSPIGNYVSIENIEKLIAEANKYGIPVLIDEAYYEYAGNSSIQLIDKYENLAISRTFSKALGGAGIRIGYVLGNKVLIRLLAKSRMMYEVNQVGVKFAEHILQNYDEVSNYVEQTKKEKTILENKFVNMGFAVISSNCNWIHLHGGNSHSKIIEILENSRVLFKNANIPHDERDWIRVSVGPGLTKSTFIDEILSISTS
jgi:histidinol-phosphate aminotransferase